VQPLQEWLMVRWYAALPALAGALLGLLLGFMSAQGLLDVFSPGLRAVIGVAASSIISAMLVPVGAVRNPPLTKGKVVEGVIAGVISTLVVWPVAYLSFAS